MDRPHKRTYIYVDGFNLFYGGLKGSRYKWLDLRKLLERAMPKNEIEKIWYFTAMVKPSESDPSKDARQQSYVRALQTLEGVEVDYGYFRLLVWLHHPDGRIRRPWHYHGTRRFAIEYQ